VALPFADSLADSIARAKAWSRSGRARRFAERAAPFAVLVLALVVRLRFVEEHPPGLYVVADMEFYDRRADHLLSGQLSVWDTFTPVGYPALLALLYATLGKSHQAVGVVQAFLGAGTCLVASAIARRITGSRIAALAVGAALAAYSPLVMYTGFLLTETSFSFLVALGAWLVIRAIDERSLRIAALAGLALGVATAVRPNLVIALPILAACSLLCRPDARARKAPLVAVLCALPILAGVAVHNTRLAGRPAFLATNGGLNFFLGHCECRAVRFDGQKISEVSGYHNRKRFTAIVHATEPAYAEGHFYRAGLSALWNDPSKIMKSITNVADGFAVGGFGPPPAQPYWPGWNGHDRELRWFARGALWLAFVPALLGTIVLAARGRLFHPDEAPRLVLIAILLSVPLTLYLFLGDPRLRVSFDPLALALAADAWASLGRRIRALGAPR
jgi:4-amino-4-deoxy-L-arabinose transferase-like glycosyltransferase